MDAATQTAVVNPCLEAALEYRSYGWSVLCLCPWDHVGVGKEHHASCPNPGKVPLHPWKELQTKPVTEKEIRLWWRTWSNANVGICLGNLIRIDIDGESGEQRLAEMSAGFIPETLEFTSGRSNGGRGLLYKSPPGMVLHSTHDSKKKKEELRFQALGAQTVLPPSRHFSGSYYAWAAGKSPKDIQPSPAPSWLIEALRPSNPESNGSLLRAPSDGEQELNEGQRNSKLASMAGSMRRAGFGFDAIFAAIAEENRGKCSPPLGENEVRKIAKSISRYEPVPDSSQEPPDAHFDWLRRHGVPVSRVIKLGTKQGVFDLVLDNGDSVQLGAAADVLNSGHVQASVADSLAIIIPEVKRADWRPIAQGIFDAAVVDDIGTDQASEVREWIDAFIEGISLEATADPSKIIDCLRSQGAALDDKGRLYLSLPKFIAAAFAVNGGERVRGVPTKQWLKRLGFTTKQLQNRAGKNINKARAWVSEENFIGGSQNA